MPVFVGLKSTLRGRNPGPSGNAVNIQQGGSNTPIYDTGLYPARPVPPRPKTHIQAERKLAQYLERKQSPKDIPKNNTPAKARGDLFTINPEHLGLVKLLNKGESYVHTDPGDFASFSRVVYALNRNAIDPNAYVIHAERFAPDKHNRTVIKYNSRKVKSFVNPGNVAKFTIFRLV